MSQNKEMGLAATSGLLQGDCLFMKCPAVIAIVLLVVVGSHGLGDETSCSCAERDGGLKRFSPAGGWHPDCGGLLHWWRQDCFPRCGAPDAYCRKPMPCVCRPSYPPWYVYPQPRCAGGSLPGCRHDSR